MAITTNDSVKLLLSPAKLIAELKRRKTLRKYNLDPDKIHDEVSVKFPENVKMGPNSYMNSGHIIAGTYAKITIGDWCAIGHNVTINATTRDLENPTGPDFKSIGKDIVIGDHVWIGNNVYIKEGIKIGNHVVIGANSMVTKDIEDYAVVGGVPAKVLKYLKKK